MKKQSAETNSKDSKLARRDFVWATSAAGAGLLIPSSIAFGSTANSSLGLDVVVGGGKYGGGQAGVKAFSKECDVGQGFNFKPDEHHTFGYINRFKFGDQNIAPDIKVVEPAAVNKPAPSGSAGGATADTSGVFTKAVVGVLSQVTWSTLPTDNITFQGRISPANMQLLNTLIMQSLKSVSMTISFVVYEYDPTSKVYFTCFKSLKGTTPSSLPAQPGGGAGFGAETVEPPIYGVLAKTSGAAPGIKIDPKPKDDPIGFKNFTLDLILAPPIAKAPQQLQIQTSDKNKLIRPWGIPQN